MRRNKTELDLATETYRKTLNAGTPTSHFDELGPARRDLGTMVRGTRLVDPRHARWHTLERGTRGRGSARPDRAIPGLDRGIRDRDPPISVRGRQGIKNCFLGKGRTLLDALADVVPQDARDRDQTGSPRSLTVPVFVDFARASGLDFTLRQRSYAFMPDARDDGGWRRLARLRRRRLARYLRGARRRLFPTNRRRPPSAQRDRLFRNRGDGTFEDVTAAAGLAAMSGGYGHGVTVGDYDNDGRPDLFITRWRSYALYHNRGDGTFEDVTAAAGLSGSRDWPTSAAFADLDGDGDLDLYVCHYSAWDPQTSPPCPHPGKPGKYSYCGPRVFDAMPDHLFRNDGGRFVDVSEPGGRPVRRTAKAEVWVWSPPTWTTTAVSTCSWPTT